MKVDYSNLDYVDQKRKKVQGTLQAKSFCLEAFNEMSIS